MISKYLYTYVDATSLRLGYVSKLNLQFVVSTQQDMALMTPLHRSDVSTLHLQQFLPSGHMTS